MTLFHIVNQKRPNQTPEPTMLAVTPRACARVAPSSVVAHLFRWANSYIYFACEHISRSLREVVQSGGISAAVVLQNAGLEISNISQSSVLLCSERARVNFRCRVYPPIAHVNFQLLRDGERTLTHAPMRLLHRLRISLGAQPSATANTYACHVLCLRTARAKHTCG